LIFFLRHLIPSRFVHGRFTQSAGPKPCSSQDVTSERRPERAVQG
jgi:hypothetical protein